MHSLASPSPTIPDGVAPMWKSTLLAAGRDSSLRDVWNASFGNGHSLDQTDCLLKKRPRWELDCAGIHHLPGREGLSTTGCTGSGESL